MGKKKKYKIKDIKSINIDFELCVPKEIFDDLLKKMAHLQQEEQQPPKESDNKDENKK